MMNVYKVTLQFVLLVLSTTFIQSADQNVSNLSVTELVHQKIEARLENLQWEMVEKDLVMAKYREIVNQQLLSIPTAINLLNRTENQSLIELETKFNNSELQEDLTSNHQKLSNETSAALSQFRNTIAQNLIAWQKRSFLVMKKYQESNNQLFSKVVDAMDQFSESILQNINTSQVKETKPTDDDKHEQRRLEIQKLATKADLGQLLRKSGLDLRNVSSRSCKEGPSKQSGKYIIKPTEYDAPFLGYCEQATLGGGWLVIQYRYDGSVDFFRNWTEYRNGFGRFDGEFWLGLELLHRLTTARPHELLVELKDWNGSYSFARYSTFEVGCEADQYVLAKLGSYTGTAGNSLVINRNEKFTTTDRDNDAWSNGNCATDNKGAWWYSMCGVSNLNGVYMNSHQKVSMHWWGNNDSRHGVAYSRMMIREI